MRIGELISQLEELRKLEGDLIVTFYSENREWQKVYELAVHPARRPYRDPHGRELEHAEKVVEIR